jgi:hypothetical protein
MWYTVESGKSTIRDEGELRYELTHRNLREMFRLPSLDAVSLGLSGDFSSLMKWGEGKPVEMLPFTFEKDRRIKFDLVPIEGNVVVGSVLYGASKKISATFNRTNDAKEILLKFYQHWLISYSHLGSSLTMKI